MRVFEVLRASGREVVHGRSGSADRAAGLLFGMGDQLPFAEALQYASGHDLSGMFLDGRFGVEQLLQLTTFEEPELRKMLKRLLLASWE
jgi:hypothetical protein